MILVYSRVYGSEIYLSIFKLEVFFKNLCVYEKIKNFDKFLFFEIVIYMLRIIEIYNLFFLLFIFVLYFILEINIKIG